MAARAGGKLVSMQNLEDAKDKIMMGPERRSMIMQKEEKELTAYHEAGHAITAINSPNSDPIHKATIIPRGRALGLVMRLPEKDRFSVTRAKLLDDLVVAMGGRASEEIIFGYDKVTTGASSDIEQATQMARSMVTSWGLSDKLGSIDYTQDAESKYGITSQKFSDNTMQTIDDEIKKIVDEALSKAKKIINEKRADIETLAKALLEYETLSGDEIKDLLAGIEIRKSPSQILEVSINNQSAISAINNDKVD
jgi:cell division protease FtsH